MQAEPGRSGNGIRRAVARWSTWWIRLFVASVFLLPALGLPRLVALGILVGLFALSLVRPAWDRDLSAVPVDPPVRGRWVALNSPATKVPSHGLRAYGQTYAIDIFHPRPPGTPTRIGWGLGLRPPERFTTFGEPVRAMADGVVVATSSRQRDHLSRLTWPSLAYLLTVEGFFRELGGARFVLGNHVVIDHGDGLHSAYAHLRRGSLAVAAGDRVEAGQQLGEVGNSGNSSEPHLHVQLMDDPSVTGAAGVPFRWDRIELSGETDPTIDAEPTSGADDGVPPNGQVFLAA
jgi:murein DD-endopeptidase MepM/ murein hydrolase activator NlpD